MHGFSGPVAHAYLAADMHLDEGIAEKYTDYIEGRRLGLSGRISSCFCCFSFHGGNNRMHVMVCAWERLCLKASGWGPACHDR